MLHLFNFDLNIHLQNVSYYILPHPVVPSIRCTEGIQNADKTLVKPSQGKCRQGLHKDQYNTILCVLQSLHCL